MYACVLNCHFFKSKFWLDFILQDIPVKPLWMLPQKEKRKEKKEKQYCHRIRVGVPDCIFVCLKLACFIIIF